MPQSRSLASIPISMRSGANRWTARARRSPRCAEPCTASDIRFTLAFRTVVAETDDAAWEKAAHILQKVKSHVARVDGGNGEKPPECRFGASTRSGKALWTEVAEASGAGGNFTALVSTPTRPQTEIRGALFNEFYLSAGLNPNQATRWGRASGMTSPNAAAERGTRPSTG
ncbi:LLM class flavin-dependent oxidoreductase [Rhizobium leguminosarum]|nr:LLM class flavin-dependent oxidoreductase [Rhizobium leguminosarum]MBY5788135.1 LLM class flavin-dependent oxidoreductase [Rhizobium leguminosarum]NEH73663.1 LLM class flavin-dependent oxidoreductase [Rhizobium leguminosarum]NEI93894.1 LLM class flavin-dependent oxidoreductase [Rhizobium leguminosarum]TBZ54606.1 LLM class flavin-dependent oxidoreductase [Rhizobium leguminosarum bv. viciae]